MHSFKGWEARAIVIGIGRTAGSRRLAYVAMTRTKADPLGRTAHLSIVNSDTALEPFGELFVAPTPVDWSPPDAHTRIAAG